VWRLGKHTGFDGPDREHRLCPEGYLSGSGNRAHNPKTGCSR
jgi:hypothetical protein